MTARAWADGLEATGFSVDGGAQICDNAEGDADPAAGSVRIALD